MKPKKIKFPPYQKQATKFALKKKSCALYIDPGMGKTAIALAVIKIRKQKKQIKKVLIIAEIMIIYNVWPDEIKKWKQFNELKSVILHGKDKDETILKEADIYLTNFHGLKWLFENQLYHNFDMLIIDESSKFKNPSSERFKLLKKYLNYFKYRIIMSGTPAPNSLQDVFSQIYILDLGKAFGKFITHFRNRYFDLVNPRFFTYRIKPGAEKAIQKKIAPLAYVLKNLKIEKPFFNYIKVSLDPCMQKKYDSMEKNLFAEIDKEKVLALSAGSAYNKCHQMANGALYKENSKDYFLFHENKLDAIENLVDELQGKQILIGYLYRHDLKQLQGSFPNAPHIGGGVSISRRKKILSFWDRGQIQILLGQLGSISHGLNLQKSGCQDVCYFSLTDDLDMYEQFYRRVYGRHGSKSLVRVHHIIVKDTVDEAILAMLKRKDKTQTNLLNAIQEYRERKTK